MRFFVLLTFLFSIESFGSPAEETKKNDESISLLDKAQNLIGSKLNYLANNLDSFFATERADDEFGRSSIRIAGAYTMRERESGDLSTRYRFNLRLPHLEEKFKYSYYQDKKGKKVDPADEAERERFKKLSEVQKGWLFNADAGVSVAIPPKIIMRARLRRTFETGTFIHRFVEQLTYVTDESGLIEETSLFSDYSLKENLLFRFQNSKRWKILHKEFTTSHGPQILHRLSDNDALNYSFATSSTIINGSWFVTGHNFSIDYRRNLYKQWLYLDLIPGLDFPKNWSFRRTPYFIIQIEALFGG